MDAIRCIWRLANPILYRPQIAAATFVTKLVVNDE